MSTTTRKFKAYGDNRFIIISKRALLVQVFALIKACEAIPTPLDAEELAACYTAQATEHVDKLSEKQVDEVLDIAIVETIEVKHNPVPNKTLYACAFDIALQWLAASQNNLSYEELEQEIIAKAHQSYKRYLAVKTRESTKVKGDEHETTR